MIYHPVEGCMRIRSAVVLCALATVATSCSSGIDVRTMAAPDFSLAGRMTFHILPVPLHNGRQLGPNDPMLANSITNQALYEDIRRAFEARGYRPARRGRADFEIAPYASAREALDIQTYNYGYTWRGWPRQYTQVTPYTRGTVIIDIVDPGTHQLMWRGRGVAAISDDPDTYVKELGKVVKAIVKKVPSAGGA